MNRMSRTSWIVAVGLVVVGSGLLGQAKPNFSGRWVQVSPEPGAGREDLVTHTATTLTIEGVSRKEPPVTFNLDGTESRSVVAAQGREIVTLSKTEWVGSSLMIMRTMTLPDGSKATIRHQMSVDAEGRLVIVTSAAMPGMPVRDDKVIYTKK